MISFDFSCNRNGFNRANDTNPKKTIATIKCIEERKCENIWAIQFDEIGVEKATTTHRIRIANVREKKRIQQSYISKGCEEK